MSGTQVRDGKRILLAIVLGIIAAVLIVGGGYLLSLGGSAYYLLAGLAVGCSAYFSAKGDTRGIKVYLAMLAVTFVWALFESHLDPWGVQARVLAPSVLGVWVAFPYIRLVPGKVLAAGIGAIVMAGAIGLYISTANEQVNAPAVLAASGNGEWKNYGNDLGGSRFSPLTQINAKNISQLQAAWTYRTGVLTTGLGFEATPLMVDDTLYLCTPNNIIIALDPETGQQRWKVDPKVKFPPAGTCRGVSYFKVPQGQGACAERIIFATTDARLMAVDAKTGNTCSGFGDAGTVNLKHRMGQVLRGYYYVSSAPTIVRGRVVLGGWVADGQHVGEPSGVIRAFDAVTGQFAWAWDMDRPDFHGEPAEGQTYSRGTANSWAPMSGDEELGMVYVPTGNSTPDYWGAHRSPGSEKYSAAVVALDAETGAPRWHYQTSHHDLWDYDVASQPTLINLPIDGKTVPALIQPTKRGQIFVLDRRNGTLLAKVDERPVPQGAASGDWTARTQPFSTGMPAFDETVLTEAQMWGATPVDQLWCRIKFRQARYEGPMTPPGVKPFITYPSYLGGVDWGGVSIDPERLLMVVNWNRMANYSRLVPRAEADAMGVKLSSNGDIHVGLPVPQMGTPFALLNGAFLSPLGMPCTQPPFGKIAVVDLKSRKVTWERTLGTSRDSGPLGMSSMVPLPMGVPNIGGSLTTRAGLVFIAATQERAIRAFDIKTGKQLWEMRLPVGGHATPMSYISPKSGRQFIVLSTGGNASMASGTGDYVMAFALPKGP